MVEFPDLNYIFWMDKNEFFSNKIGLSKTIEIGIKHVKKARPDLVTQVLQETPIKSNIDLVKLIQKKIVKANDIESCKKEDLLLVFDLIQAWGGQTGRGPYVQPVKNPVRADPTNPLPHIYKNAVNAIYKKEFEESLRLLTSIDRVNESFATKHIFFWSKFGPNKEALPIYDTRLKLLLFQTTRDAPPYEQYVNSLKEKAEELKIQPEDVERALFSFSQFYFFNNKLIIKKNISKLNSSDVKEANRLENLYLSKMAAQLSKC